MGSKNNYNELMAKVEEQVKEEIPAFKALVPYRKFQQLIGNIRYYCEWNRSANKFRSWETTKPHYASNRQESEYYEVLAATRLRLRLQACEEDDLQRYVFHLNSKLEEALVEKDTKKRFKMYDYICAGCLHCRVDNEQIMSAIGDIRNRAKEIISQIPSM